MLKLFLRCARLLIFRKRLAQNMSLNIELLWSNRERALRGCPEASATFTFTISDGPFKARAEVMLTNGDIEIIERAGKKAKPAARLALERLLVAGFRVS